MSNIAKFYKVTTLPVTLESNAFYYVANGDYAESYLTDNTGTAKMIGNSVMTDELIDSKLAGLNGLTIVADIVERDALVLASNEMILVLDASADATVATGAATYAYKHDTTEFIKVAEYESMDVTVEWANIANKPTSTTADIDDAVTKKHTHTNLAELNKIGEDANGDITYNGTSIGVFNTLNW